MSFSNWNSGAIAKLLTFFYLFTPRSVRPLHVALERVPAFQRKWSNKAIQGERSPKGITATTTTTTAATIKRHYNTEQLPSSPANEPKLLSKVHKVPIFLYTLLMLSSFKFYVLVMLDYQLCLSLSMLLRVSIMFYPPLSLFLSLPVILVNSSFKKLFLTPPGRMFPLLLVR